MRKKPLLILDIDETLLYTNTPKEFRKNSNMEPDFEIGEYLSVLRPFLENFLKEVSSKYDLALYSSASPNYVQFVKENVFDPLNIPLVFTFSSDQCTFDGGKRLYLVTDNFKYPLNKIYVLEDNPSVYDYEDDIESVLKIKKFKGDRNDRELLKVMKQL